MEHHCQHNDLTFPMTMMLTTAKQNLGANESVPGSGEKLHHLERADSKSSSLQVWINSSLGETAGLLGAGLNSSSLIYAPLPLEI